MPSINSERRHELWGVVDCNNFYASCEKLFRPDLRDTPVVVLSNNDGCIIARSGEARALGVPMGEAWFKVKDLLEHINAVVFSANFPLYGEISNRVMGILESMCPKCEQYSIDEAFLRLDGALVANLPEFCRDLRNTIKKWLGITVSVGIGATPTLAKLANHIAKKRADGLYSLVRPQQEIDHLLAATPVVEVWGIGRRHRRKLLVNGINNALQLKNLDDGRIRSMLTVSGLRTALELRGIVCQEPWENFDRKRRTILHSRSFGNRINGFEELAEAVSCFTARCAERMRVMRLAAGGVWVRIRTSNFDQGSYAVSSSFGLQLPADDTGTLVAAAKKILGEIFVSGYPYAKAAVMFYDLVEKNNRQLGLFEKNSDKSDRLMEALDRINQRYGRLALRYGAMGMHKADWHMRQERRSPAYMTDWNELAVARLC